MSGEAAESLGGNQRKLHETHVFNMNRLFKSHLKPPERPGGKRFKACGHCSCSQTLIADVMSFMESSKERAARLEGIERSSK